MISAMTALAPDGRVMAQIAVEGPIDRSKAASADQLHRLDSWLSEQPPLDQAMAHMGVAHHLLRPKIGGLGYVLEDMDQHLHRLLDVTIVYPEGAPNFWDFLQGKCPRVEMDITPHVIRRGV